MFRRRARHLPPALPAYLNPAYIYPNPVQHLCPGGAQKLCDLGYSSMDIITTLFRVVRNFPDLAEFLKLEFIRV